MDSYEIWMAADPKRSQMTPNEHIVAWVEFGYEEQDRNNANPQKTFHYTPFGQVVSVNPITKLGYSCHWGCTFWRKLFGKPCEFDLTKDSACDHCLHCRQPEERK